MTTTQRIQFVAPGGLRVPAVSVAEMREVDRIAIEATGPRRFSNCLSSAANRPR